MIGRNNIQKYLMRENMLNKCRIIHNIHTKRLRQSCHDAMPLIYIFKHKELFSVYFTFVLCSLISPPYNERMRILLLFWTKPSNTDTIK